MTKQKHFYLLRGLIREAEHWGEFPELLTQAIPGSRYTLIDIPGAGKYFRSPSPLSIKKMVEKMRQSYLETAQEGEERILLAISLGGMISAQWLKDYPQDFEKVILMNTSYGGISPLFDRLKPSALLHLLKVPVLQGRAKEAHILRLVSNHDNVFDSTLNLWDKIYQERPVSLSNSLRQLTAAGLFRIGHFKPQIPVLLLASVQDRMVSVECSRAIGKKWGFEVIEHPTAGHDLSADDPAWIVKHIQEFLR